MGPLGLTLESLLPAGAVVIAVLIAATITDDAAVVAGYALTAVFTLAVLALLSLWWSR